MDEKMQSSNRFIRWRAWNWSS